MRAARDAVYHTLMRRMAPDHKFSTQAKLVAEVSDGALMVVGGWSPQRCSLLLSPLPPPSLLFSL